MRKPERVMIISFDAVGREDLPFLKTLPNFAAHFQKGALCTHVKSVYPSLTYPAHTSIITGRMPKNHGIINNTKRQPKRERADWCYQRKLIRSTTLYDEAKRKGIKTAALLWPVIGRSGIDYYVPEVMVTRKWQTQILVNALNGPIGYQLYLNRRYGRLRDGIRQPALDNFVQACALDTIRKHNPGLFLLHLTDVDTNRHIYGVRHDRVTDALARQDARLGEIMTALSETGDMNDTTVILLGDHYQKDTKKVACMNAVLREAGLLQVKNGRICDYRAVAKTCDGSCYIYLKEGSKAPDALKKQVRELAEEWRRKDDFGIAAVFSRQEAGRLGADPSCFLMLEGKPGWYFLDDFTYPAGDVGTEKKNRMQGTHGYLPDDEAYQTFFAASGCGIKAGVLEKEIALWDEGVTIASLMGLDLGAADGRVIEEILEK